MSTPNWSRKHVSVNNVELAKAACTTFELFRTNVTCRTKQLVLCCVYYDTFSKGYSCSNMPVFFFELLFKLAGVQSQHEKASSDQLLLTFLRNTAMSCRTDMCQQVARGLTSSHQLHSVTNNPRPDVTGAVHFESLFTSANPDIITQTQHVIDHRSHSCAST